MCREDTPLKSPCGSLDTISNLLDTLSLVRELDEGINKRIANRIAELRSARGLSLDAAAAKSGVSRSMISLIERGESSPTAVVLEKLATGLGVTLASLFDIPADPMIPRGPISRHQDQHQWRDPASGYVRRNVSPPGQSQRAQIVEVHFPAGARVAFETGARDPRVHQQVWMLKGSINITVGSSQHNLQEGDCLAMQLDQPTMFHNPGRQTARYAVILSPESPVKR